MNKFYFAVSFLILIGCKKKEEFNPTFGPKDLEKVILEMTDVMIHDVTNPPLAARFFAYSLLAANETVVFHDSKITSLSGKINEFPKVLKPSVNGEYHKGLAVILAMYETAKKLQPSGNLLDELENKWIDSLIEKGISKEVLENSLLFAKDISSQILKYAKADKYRNISNYPRYTPKNTDGTWYPTPPGYFPPVEPYFHTIRSFTLEKSDQFKPDPPIAFSLDKKSSFYDLMSEIESFELKEEHKSIAAFWDCNPFALFDNGHLLVGMKKISPGAHWMGIANIACIKKGFDLSKSVQVNTVLAIGLMDGFQSCWDEKYRSNRIRPETAIRKFINPKWQPFLQTPPFPEYLSGHSTISSVSAVILTHFFGPNFEYTDSVENRFGLKERTYKSFEEAAAEASISRFYGGIHFMDAIENGQKQGNLVGKHVLDKVFDP